MAGPGGTIRVDGFRGGRLPPKSQIRSIRFTSGMFAAENHGGGMMFVDISTAAGPRTAARQRRLHVPRRRAERAECVPAGEGTRAQSAIHVQSERDAVEGADLVLAVGRRRHAVRLGQHLRRHAGRHAHRRRCGGRATGSTSPAGSITRCQKSHTLRAMFQQNDNDQQNLGVGGLRSRRARLQADVARQHAAARRERAAGRAPGSASRGCRCAGRTPTSAAVLEQPAVRVLDAFTSGGAQQAGGRDAAEIEWATNVDWARGRHAVRFGSLVEGGPLSQRQPHQLSRHLHVRQPRRLPGRHRRRPTPGATAIRWSSTRTGRPGSSCRTTGGRAGT